MTETINEINRLAINIKSGCEKLKSKCQGLPIDKKALESWQAFWNTQRNIYLISERFHNGIAELCKKLDRDIEDLKKLRRM
jgi:hypothetical protein